MSNEEVVKTASLPSIEFILLQAQLCWDGHVTRKEDVIIVIINPLTARVVGAPQMEDIHMPKAVFFSELQEEKRNRGAPRKCYKDHLKRQLAQAGISHQSWEQDASDQDIWHSSVRKASCEFEAERHKATKEKRMRQKE